jgi:hypothetical protein
LGALVLVSYVLQAYGLQTISSNHSAFLTSLNVLMVPFLGLLFGNRLRPAAVVLRRWHASALYSCRGKERSTYGAIWLLKWPRI